MSDTPEVRRRPVVQWCAGALAWFFDVLPRWLCWGFAHGLTWLWFDVVRFRRGVVLKNLAIAFPGMDAQERRRIGRRSIANLVFGVSEFFQLPRIDHERAAREGVLHGLEHYERARAGGRGLLALSMHLGNGDKAMTLAAVHGVKLHVISKRMKNDFFDALWFAVRHRPGIAFIDTHGRNVAFSIMHACRQNEMVVFVIDQFAKKPFAVETTFFGKTAATAFGLALFALKTKAPVLPVYCYRDADDRTHVVFEEPIPPVEDPDRDRAIQATTQRYNDRIEAIVRAHPEHWLWLHKRWKPIR